MNLIFVIFLFYRRVAFPSLIISILFGATGIVVDGRFSFQTAGLSYLLMTILLQYFRYDVASPGTYYFYHNLGFSRRVLWSLNILISILIFFVMNLL